MTREAMGDALETMFGDHEVVEKIAGGDFDGLGDLDDGERSLLQKAAVEISESDVSGFSFTPIDANITLDNGIKKPQGITLDNGIKMMPSVRDALDYLGRR